MTAHLLGHGFGLLHAEWTKFRTVRGWVIGRWSPPALSIVGARASAPGMHRHRGKPVHRVGCAAAARARAARR